MIQRKQTIWLLLAALLNASVFYFDLYRAHMLVNGADSIFRLRVSDHFPSLLVALIMTLLPFVSIFLFSQRKRQVNFTLISMLFTAGFIAMVLWRVSNVAITQPVIPGTSAYWIGSVMPVIAFILLMMAIFGIRKDEKLVRSVDRLR